MRITSEEAERLRKELKTLNCLPSKGITKWELIFQDSNNEIVAHLKSDQNEPYDLDLSTYDTQNIVWKNIITPTKNI